MKTGLLRRLKRLFKQPNPQRLAQFAEAARLVRQASDLEAMADTHYGGPYHNEITDRRWRTEAEQKRLEARLILTRLWEETG